MTEPVVHVESGPGGWRLRPAPKGTSGVYPDKEQAIEAAWRALEAMGGGHLVVHRADGSYELAWRGAGHAARLA